MTGPELMHDDNAYQSLAEVHEDARWAFGTGFDDPLHGVDARLPDGVDVAALAERALALGDDALIMSHRLAEWCTNAPELEDELALANIALDLLGQARLLLSRAAQLAPRARRTDGWPAEDELAFLREPSEFRNVPLAERPRGDFAQEIARLLTFATWRLAVLAQLRDSPDPVLAAVATKGVIELTYTREYAAQWAIRLGDGTAYSHERMQAGLDAIWPDVDELFVGEDPSIQAEFYGVLTQVCGAATLRLPPARVTGVRAGRHQHTAHLAELLGTMQGLARDNLDATW